MKYILALTALSAVVAADTCESPVQRKNFTSLSNDEKLAWLDAEVCLTTHDAVFGLYDGATTLWDEQQYLHLTMSNYIHGVGQFLPWHRYYMTLHEKLLQTNCNYTGGLPYWDEQADADNITLSAVWDSVYGIGGDGNSSDNQIVTDGPFANMELHVGAWSFNTVIPKTATYHLNRSISVSTFQAASQDNVDECYALETYDEAWQCYGQSPHSAGHAGTGGTMQDPVLSPGDPVFFLHHNNIDRLWWLWQSANLTARLTDMGGQNTPTDEFNAANNWDAPGANFTDYSGDPANVTTLTHILSMYEMIPNVTIADIMDIGGDVICAEMNYSIKSLNLDEEESTSELLKFYHFLDSCTRCEPGKTPAWAAQGIDEYTREDLNNMGDFLFCFWGFLIDMVLQIDHEHPAFDLLVEVIAELQKRPPIKIEAFKVSDAYFISIQAFEKMLWTDLPVLEMELLERFTSHTQGDASVDKKYQIENIRLNSFTARVLNLGLSSTRPTESLQFALEQEPCMEWDLEGASEYILRAGNTIFEHLDDPKWTELGYEGGTLYTGIKGINKERWDFWKKRFREYSQAISPGSKAQQKALEAAQKMDTIEAQAAGQ